MECQTSVRAPYDLVSLKKNNKEERRKYHKDSNYKANDMKGEHAWDLVATGFSFESDWLGKWREFSDQSHSLIQRYLSDSRLTVQNAIILKKYLNVSAQTDTNEPFIDWMVAIGVKGHT